MNYGYITVIHVGQQFYSTPPPPLSSSNLSDLDRDYDQYDIIDDTSTIIINFEKFQLMLIVSEYASAVPIYSFKFVGDNFDKDVKPRDMRFNRQTQSLHYFNVYAVRDRIDTSNFSEKHESPPTLQLYDFLPSNEDYSSLKENFKVLVSRILCQNMKFFKNNFSKSIQWHIEHQYSSEMKRKSQIVPLGVIFKNEAKYEEMIEIMDCLHKYVPSLVSESTVAVNNEEREVKDELLYPICFGGDQMSASRYRGSRIIRSNSTSATTRLEGLFAVNEDWHSQLTLLKSIWVRLRNCKSGMQRGTLMQLQLLINRKNVKNEPKQDFSACEDFFMLVVTSHILCAAMEHLQMNTLDDEPVCNELPEDFWLYLDHERSAIVDAIAESIITKFVDISMSFDGGKSKSVSGDHVFEYACEVVSLGLFYMNYKDAIREGDGNRVHLTWKYMLSIFMATSRKNYSVEAFHTLANYKLLPPRQSHQLLWSRFINLHDNTSACNIPCDLHNEHLNRMCKEYVRHLGANKTQQAISRFSRCMGPLFNIMSTFDQENGCHQTSSSHTSASVVKDRDMILEELMQTSKVFKKMPERCHASFPKFCCNPIRKLDWSKFKMWISKQAKGKGLNL
jgi:L1 cell adhesion molecule like protein